MSVSLIEKLTALPVDLTAARLPADKGGVPDAPGFYAWWLADKMPLPDVPTSAHPTQPQLGLVYIGIAPKDATSAETLRSRILKKHLGNALGSSTLRRGLTALLWEGKDWHLSTTPSGKPTIPLGECIALTRWMEANLRVSWCRVEHAWDYEATLLQDMQPPLNSEHNHGHPFYPTLRAGRKHMMAIAREATAATSA